MDEMPSLSRNNFTGRVNEEKVKKKKKRGQTNDQQELTGSSHEQTEKRREKKDKRKNSQTESDINLQTLSGKKKRRNLDNEGETSVMNDGVSNLHEAQTQELQCSSEEKPTKRKKKREKVKQSNYEDNAKEEQTDISTKHEEEPNASDGESGPPKLVIGTKKPKRQPTPIDLKLLAELKELCPPQIFENRTLFSVGDAVRYDLARLREFKKQGIEIRIGRFSTAENERLRQNVSNFMALTGVDDAGKLFFPYRYPKEKNTLRMLKKKHRFFEKIAEGIPRFCLNVYNRGTKIFDVRNNKGFFTEEEEKSLYKYYKLYGPNWKKISDKTGRGPRNLYRHILLFSKLSGPWTTKEVQRLLRAVRDHVVSVLKSANPKNRKPKRVSREMLSKNLPWTIICKKVKTRNWLRCRDKWMRMLSARISSGTTFRGRKALEVKIKLIKAMYEMQVEDVVYVDWEDLTAVIGDTAPANAQAKWHGLKVCYVPDWKNKCFGDIVDFLYENVLPELVKECEYLDDDEVNVDKMLRFRLADIFHDIEDECCDSDEETGQQEKHSST